MTGENRPLEGITVVALEQAVAGPFASRQLADLGARVIKVERPILGDFARAYDRTVHGQSSYFVWLNRSKESIELDLKSDADVQMLRRLIDAADVFIQNLAPGTADRLGLSAANLRAGHEKLIHCSISGYGRGGPSSEKKAYDLLVQCESGLVHTTGAPTAAAKVGISVADIATGMYAFAGILTALYRRETTGEGAALEIAMLDALGEWMMQPTYYTVYGDRPWQRTGARHPSIAPYGPYRVGDGATIYLAVQNDREWQRLCTDVLGRPELTEDLRFAHNTERVENDGEISVWLEAFLRDKTLGEAEEIFAAAGIACARLRSPAEFFDHPQLRARHRWKDVPTPGGPVAALLPPVVMTGVDPVMNPVPELGAHNAKLREEFVQT